MLTGIYFDCGVFLVLQFRVERVVHIKSSRCSVDCWDLPHKNDYGTTYRYILYRLLVQGLRGYYWNHAVYWRISYSAFKVLLWKANIGERQ